MRYLEPQMELQNERFAQELINKGVDPNSEAVQRAFRQKSMGQNDMLSMSAFDAMSFGTDIQNQMFGQDMQNTQQAGNMQQALWQAQLGQSGQGIKRYGMDQQFEMGQSGQALQQRMGDQANALGMGNLDMNRQGQSFNQMMGMESVDFRNRQFNRQGNQYQDALTMSLMGQTPIPGVTPINPGGIAGAQYGNNNPGIL